jgi:iron complex outermembrane receptor protein
LFFCREEGDVSQLKNRSVPIIWAMAFCATAAAQDPPAEATPPAESPPAEATAEQPVATVAVPDEPEAVAAPGDNTFDTIEVTAQRRRERLVDVPVAVTAITQDQIETRGIGRLDDLNSVAPGLQVSRSPSNTTISQLTIRGSSQINPAIYWDPAVGVYLDGVYIGKGQGAIFDIVDLSSIEVLRGPQGTLYGRNTIAGTVNFLTREPSGRFAGNAAVEYGNLGARVLRASMDLPSFGDFAELTLGVRQEERDPWVETTPTSPVDGMNNRNNEGAHVGALLHLTDGLEAMYHLDYSKTDQTNTFLQLFRYNDTATCGGPTDPCLEPFVSRERRETADLNAPSVERADITGHSLILTWAAADWLTVKSITGYRDVQWLDHLDLDGAPEDVAHSMRDTTYEQKSQDLNFSGSFDLLGDVQYTLGAYYFADEGFTNNPIHVLVSNLTIDFDSRYGTQAEAEALYGQASWNPWEPLTLTAGVRRTTERKDLDRVFGQRISPAPTYTYHMPEGYRAPGADFSATTPMASVAWRVNDALNTYVRYAEGFKSGGFNGEFSNVFGDTAEHQRETNTPFRPEQQQSWEVGLKSAVAGGKALINVAAFHNKLDDLQASIFTASGAAASVVRNAGKATVDGIELEAAVVLLEGTTLRANYAWLDAAYDEFIDAVCDPPPGPGLPPANCVDENVADNRAFVHAPKSSYNVVLDSELWNTGWGTLRTTLDYAWTDEFFTYPYQLTGPGDPACEGGGAGPRPCHDAGKQSAPDTLVPAYGILNAKLAFVGIPLGGTRLGELALWGRNALDEDRVANYIDFGPGFRNLTVVNFVEPAAFGLAGILRW